MTERQGNGANGRRRPNVKRLAEARAAVETRRSATRLNAQPADALQECIDGLVADIRLAQKMVDRLPESELWRDTMVGKIPHEWIRLRDDYRSQLSHLAMAMEAKGIAERRVRVDEARAVLMAQMVRTAAERAGLNGNQIKALGSALRELAQEAQAG